MNVALKKNESRVLSVEGLTVDFDVKGKSVNILSEISFELNSGETLGIIGESDGRSESATLIRGGAAWQASFRRGQDGPGPAAQDGS